MGPDRQFSRRSLFRKGAVAAPFVVRNLLSAPRSNTLRLASFGAGGMAWYTLDGIATHPNVKLVAVADVDSARTEQVRKKYPDAKLYADWREMLSKERRNLDIACVATPDHMHAPNAMSAMRAGLHVYVQKPLAHDLHEVRSLTEYAHRRKLVTQMGIQVHSSAGYQAAVQLVQAGAIGKIKEVHSWSEKKWGDPDPMPDRSDPVPSTLNWDAWLGVTSPRPFLANYYHPANWRKRIDYGTATFGDMGCHILDPVFGSLKLTSPVSVRSEGPAPGQHSWALNSIIRYEFPGTAVTEGKTVAIHWYDGEERPPQEIKDLIGTRKMPGQGSIFVGTKGVMLLPHPGAPVLLPESQFEGFEIPKTETKNHYHQFADAVLGKQTTLAPLDYSGPLTETVLLGPLATRFPKSTLEWDAKKLRFQNSPEATALVQRKYRNGWAVKGLS